MAIYTVQNLRFRVRAGLAAAVAALNEIPLVRELVFETDTRKAKLGDGVTHYNLLPYSIDPTASITCTFVNSSGVLAVGSEADGRIPFDCDIVSWTVLADQSGSIQVDVWKDSLANYPPVDGDSITAAAPISISGATKGENTTLTGWQTSIAAGSTLRFHIDSCTSIRRAVICLKVKRK